MFFTKNALYKARFLKETDSFFAPMVSALERIHCISRYYVCLYAMMEAGIEPRPFRLQGESTD